MSLDTSVADATALLYHAVETGRQVDAGIRDPIIKMRPVLQGGGQPAPADETAFLDAYARLAALVAPVTATTLRATAAPESTRAGWARVVPTFSKAQVHALLFGLIAVIFLVAVGASELTQSFVAAMVAMQTEKVKIEKEENATQAELGAVKKQIKTHDASTGPRDKSYLIVAEGLSRRHDELDAKARDLFAAKTSLEDSIATSYKTLKKRAAFLDWDELKNVIVPFQTILRTFFLPLFYGALGTLTYILRSIYAQMGDRSFDGRRTGEFFVRIFLGMLSGITVQWLLVNQPSAFPGAVTPAVLAFLSGYSVEILFVAVDRLLDTLKAPSAGGAKPAVQKPQTTGGG